MFRQGSSLSIKELFVVTGANKVLVSPSPLVSPPLCFLHLISLSLSLGSDTADQEYVCCILQAYGYTRQGFMDIVEHWSQFCTMGDYNWVRWVFVRSSDVALFCIHQEFSVTGAFFCIHEASRIQPCFSGFTMGLCCLPQRASTAIFFCYFCQFLANNVSKSAPIFFLKEQQ